MGHLFSAPAAPERVQFMKSPDFTDATEAVTRLVCELGAHETVAVVSIGPIGVGKSSNLNTIASYLNNHLEQQAGAGDGTGSMTRDKKLHVISYQGKPVRWKWLDTPGDLFDVRLSCSASDLLDLKKKRKEVAEGRLTEDAYSRHVEETVLKPMRYHQAGCVMVMLSALDVIGGLRVQDERGVALARPEVDPSSRLRTHLQVTKHLHEKVVHEGMRMLVILTKADLIDAAIDEDVSNVAYSRAVNDARAIVNLETGVPMNQVHVVCNLVKDFCPMDNLALGQLALFNIRAALHAASHYSNAARHPSRAGSMQWDTLTVPSSLDSDDGLSGRSHKLADVHGPSSSNSQQFSEMSSYHAVYENMPRDVEDNIDARSIGRFSEACTDIDEALHREALETGS